MKYLFAALAVSSLVFAAPALAHNPVGTASQFCDEATGFAVLAASFDNPGYGGVTTVTATDSGGAELGSAPAVPAGWTRTIEGPDRAGGTVTFAWEAENGHNGSITAEYPGVKGCVDSTEPPPVDETPPPKDETHIGGPNPPNGEGPPEQPPVAPGPPAPTPDTLPYTGVPVVPMALIGFGLLGAGVSLRRLR